MLDILKNVLSEDVLTAEMQNELEQRFNEMIEIKSSEIAAETIEKEKEKLVEEYNQKFESFKTDVLSTIDTFLTEAVEEVQNSINSKLDESINNAQADALIESFESIVMSSGVDLLKISEAAKTEETRKYDELAEKFDALVQKNRDLKNEVKTLTNEKILAEASEGLTLVEAEKLKKIASLHGDSEDFAEKVKVLKESLICDKDVKVEEKAEKIEESKTEESWKRFV